MTHRPNRPGRPPWVNSNLPLAPLRQLWALRGARGSLLLTTGTASTVLDFKP